MVCAAGASLHGIAAPEYTPIPSEAVASLPLWERNSRLEVGWCGFIGGVSAEFLENLPGISSVSEWITRWDGVI